LVAFDIIRNIIKYIEVFENNEKELVFSGKKKSVNLLIGYSSVNVYVGECVRR